MIAFTIGFEQYSSVMFESKKKKKTISLCLGQLSMHTFFRHIFQNIK